MSDLIRKAYDLAEYGHKDQKRKYTGEPYFNHCKEVVRIAEQFTNDEVLLSALYCHDLLEDTTISKEIILNILGQEVLDIVMELTEVSKPEDSDRNIRKKMDRDFLATVSKKAQTGKCFDIISNASSIAEHDINFAKVYLCEMIELLKVLTKVDIYILDVVSSFVINCFNKSDVFNNIPNEYKINIHFMSKEIISRNNSLLDFKINP